MVRVGGMAYSIDIHKPIGSRISDMTLVNTGKPIDPSREYVVSGWASVNEGIEGPPVYDVVSDYVSKKKVVTVSANKNIQIKGI